ncbi:hypothetical protein ABIC37_005403 [Priestia megaterium]|uniref:hypothetical protein n=1 Tax=Priestia megaterium TaxID=1404 RepID=UPI0033964BD5
MAESRDLEKEFISLAKSIADREEEKYKRIAQEIIASMAAIIFTAVMFGWRFVDGSYNSPGFDLKIFYISFAQHMSLPFAIVLFFAGYFNLKDKRYFSGSIVIMCSLVFFWLANHIIN